MRKLLITLGLVLISGQAYAGSISLGTISADATPGGLNDNFQTLGTLVNGNIEGSTDGGVSVSNIKADSVYRINMADDADVATYVKELVNITTDSFSSGTLTSNTVRESGCDPADDSDLTSDVSACVAYVNGIRISKSATSVTYTANRDCYVDLSDTGSYNTTCVANGASQPTVAANSIRLAKVVTDGTEITSVTALYSTRVPGLVVPDHYRSGLGVSRDSATTVTVLPGVAEINSSMVRKTSTTTLTIGTAGDWAGGSSLAAANTYGFVGMDTSGNLKLHTTAPTHDNYAVSTTAGKRRYATWSSTVYRILGWFRMNGATQIYASEIGNIKEGDVSNSVVSSDLNVLAFTTTTFTDTAEINFYSSGGPVIATYTVSGDANATVDILENQITVDGSDLGKMAGSAGQSASSANVHNPVLHTPSQATHTYKGRLRVDGDTITLRGRRLIISEQ